MTGIVIIGAGGHARVLVEALAARRSEFLGFVSPEPESASGVMRGLEWIGNDADLKRRGPSNILLVNGIGGASDLRHRRMTFEAYGNAGFAFLSVIHPRAIVASDVVLGEGVQVMAAAVLQPGVQIGANTIINTGASVDHDTRIGDHAHIAPGACLAGGVFVGSAAHIGAGATVIQNIRVNEQSVVGAGAVVISDVAKSTTVTGVPAVPLSVVRQNARD